VRIATTSRFAKHWLESKHIGLIKEILETDMGTKLSVKVDLVEGDEPAILTDKLPKKPKPQPKADDEPISLPLNNQYNFETFVVGPTNRLAHACAMAIADNPGRTYNPLFVYGGAGLGKTHLMHAVGQAAVANFPDMKVAYVSGEAFTYHYITSLREHRTAEFRRKYRSIDLWLVDDIQFLVGKERTEEEFFHTYNAIYEMGKQIVLTSDRAPKDLRLDTRLLSRFECGMIADIAPPDLETRMAILETKAEFENIALSNDVILYIAKLITSNVRRLESALIQLHAYASLMKTSVTPTLAEEVLSKHFGEQAAPVIDAQKVQLEVSKKFNVDLSDLKGKSRSADIVLPRQIAMYLIRELTDSSLPSVGKAFGGRDHSTVLHACKKIEEKLEKDKSLASLVREIARLLREGKSC
jgi:chromosomal replication initiator protein